MPIDLSMKRFGQVFTKLRKFEVARLILHTGLTNIRHEKYSFECVKPNEYSNIRYIRFTTSRYSVVGRHFITVPALVPAWLVPAWLGILCRKFLFWFSPWSFLADSDDSPALSASITERMSQPLCGY